MENRTFLPVTEDQVAETKKANPGLKLELITVDLDDGRTFEAIFRRPTSALVARYVADVNSKGRDGLRHHDALCMDSIAFPSREEYFEILKDLPALSIAIAPKLIEGHGFADGSHKRPL